MNPYYQPLRREMGNKLDLGLAHSQIRYAQPARLIECAIKFGVFVSVDSSNCSHGLDCGGSSFRKVIPKVPSQSKTVVQRDFKLLLYEFGPDYEKRRKPFREQHLAYANKQVRHLEQHFHRGPLEATGPLLSAESFFQAKTGKLVLAGAIGHQLDGALLIWKDTPVKVYSSEFHAIAQSYSVPIYNDKVRECRRSKNLHRMTFM